MPNDADNSEPLFCARDCVELEGGRLGCLHPSSFCEYRGTCPVVEAERQRRRAEEQQKGD